MTDRLRDKRVLVTRADDFMGPVTVDVFREPELMQKQSFVASLRRQVPAGRLGKLREDAMFAVFLASDECGFLVGQTFPFAGGWVQR